MSMRADMKLADQYPEEMDEWAAAAYLGTVVTVIHRWQDDGAFGQWQDTPTGRQWRVRRAELDAWLAQQEGARHQRGQERQDGRHS